MSSFNPRPAFGIMALTLLLVSVRPSAFAQNSQGAPQVVVKTGSQQLRPSVTTSRILYPWKTFVTCTVFWVGEQPTQNNPVPNCKSSWDVRWMQNFGGYDNPDPNHRIANHETGEFRPKAFKPKLNPFYIALPYNDIANGGRDYKPEAERVIPWFHRVVEEDGVKSTLKGRWVQIYWKGRSCYAQWEDCGPFVTDDWRYVFGDKPPANRNNKSAGIDISPAIRDYLQLSSGDRVHWRFVETGQVPHGPWKNYAIDEQNASKRWNSRPAASIWSTCANCATSSSGSARSKPSIDRAGVAAMAFQSPKNRGFGHFLPSFFLTRHARSPKSAPPNESPFPHGHRSSHPQRKNRRPRR